MRESATSPATLVPPVHTIASVVRPVAIVVDPAQRVRRSVSTLLARLGFEVHSVRGIAQAALVLSGSHTVALVLVSADPPATEASDLLPLLSDFPAASAARIALATRAPQSVFASALAQRGVKVLADPMARHELRSLARFAREAGDLTRAYAGDHAAPGESSLP
jgi:DNA-binding NtrC family response regulator